MWHTPTPVTPVKYRIRAPEPEKPTPRELLRKASPSAAVLLLVLLAVMLAAIAHNTRETHCLENGLGVSLWRLFLVLKAFISFNGCEQTLVTVATQSVHTNGLRSTFLNKMLARLV